MRPSLRLVWREVVYPVRPVRLSEVAEALAKGLTESSAIGPPLVLGGTGPSASAVATEAVVRFQVSYGGLAVLGTVELSGSPSTVYATYSVGLPRGWAVLGLVVAYEVALWLTTAPFGAPFPGELGVLIPLVLGGNHLLFVVSMKHRMLDLFKDAVASAFRLGG